MALVSPGLQLTVTDESQYVPGAVGSVPLVLLATAQDKTNPSGSTAAGTTKANAGKLQAYASQRELVSAFGYPTFQQSAAGTSLHGDERNEYGLMAAYSSLGIGNRVFAIRADIDLDELVPTSVRPVGAVADGTFWMDLTATDWGIYEWNRESGSFEKKTVAVLTATDDVVTVTDTFGNPINRPQSSFGSIGDYAAVLSPNPTSGQGAYYNSVWRIWKKNTINTWDPVGNRSWQSDNPVVVGTNISATVASSSPAANITINSNLITIGSTVSDQTLSDVRNSINAAAVTGVSARIVNNQLQITANSAIATGNVAIGYNNTAGQTALSSLGIAPDYYNLPATSYGSYVSIPAWRTGDDDANGRPTGSIFFKTSAIGQGANFVIKKYSAANSVWTTQAAPAYEHPHDALYGLDPSGGGANIAAGSVYVRYNVDAGGFGSFKPYVRRATGQTKIVSGVASPTFTIGNTYTITATQPGTSTQVVASVTLTGTTKTSFVQDTQLALGTAGITNVVVTVESSGYISFTHRDGGNMLLRSTGGTPVETAGFDDITIPGIIYNEANLAYELGNWVPLVYTPSLVEPTQDPADGTLWYYSNAVEVDIMVNTSTGWKGYRNETYDSRGYNLSLTDSTGVIVSASRPTSQVSGSSLVAGDLWLDAGDLENYPALYRYTGSSWSMIDNSDQIGQNGIVFADARWDSTGTTDPVSDNMPSTTGLLTSDYTDLDCPDYRLYPRGILLFNTRRSGYNVKRFVGDYFNTDSFNIDTFSASGSYAADAKVVYDNVVYVNVSGGTVAGSGGNPSSSADWSPLSVGTWVSASGLKDNGSMYAGSQAQRAMVVAALKAAVDGNTAVREEQYAFNLIAAPGYPELIANMVSLNNDRANTAFIIGDTPMKLAPNTVDIVNWSNNADNSTGLTTNDPYLGVYYPGAAQTNDIAGNTVIVPPSHVALRTFLQNDNVSYQWFAPAGARRGLVDNASSVGYIDSTSNEYVAIGVNQGLRDTLYENKINPITNLPGVGLVVWGQKTRNPFASAMDRVNVARLVNYIRTILAQVGNGFLFEPNDKITRDQIKNVISGAINDLVSKRGVYDYLVVCDESNNTPARIARNELYVDVAIEPMKDVEFIYIPIRLYNPGDIAKLGK